MAGGIFATVLAVHAAVLCVLGAFALRPGKGSPLALALAALLYNAVPVSPLLGMPAPIYLHDLAVPLIVALVLWRGHPPGDGRLLVLVALAAFLWPALGTLVGLTLNTRPALGENAQFLFRRLAFVVYFAAGLSGVLKRGQLAQLLDAALVIWVAMSVAAGFQYAGVLETDLWTAIAPDAGEQDFDALPLARGFMGLNRGAVGVWGATAVSYAVAMFAITPRRSFLRTLGYGVAAALSLGAILLSGSRTGLIAAGAGVAFTAVRLAGAGRFGAVWRVAASAVAMAAAAVIAGAHVDLEALSDRFSATSNGYETGHQRAEVQDATVDYVMRDLRALTIGMGHSVVEFRRQLGDRYDLSHSHSEYVEVLWEAGVVGLVLYLALLVVLFLRLRPAPGGPDVLFAGRSIMVAGFVAGTAVGNFFITSARLAPFSLLMAFVYGAYVHEADAARRAASAPAASGAQVPPEKWSPAC